MLVQLQGLQALGMDMASLCAEVAAIEPIPADPQARIPVRQYLVMWAAAQAQFRAQGRDCLPSALALAIPFGAFGMLDYLSGSASTLGGCCESVALHLRMVTDETHIEIVHLPDRISLQLLSVMPTPPEAAEFTLALLVSRLRHLLAPDFMPLGIHLPAEAPTKPLTHLQLFGRERVYGAPMASLSLRPTDWQRPIRQADAYLHQLLRQLATPLALGTPGAADLEQSLRARLRDALAEGDASAQRLARLIGLSERTLQRRLTEAGRSFSAIVEDFRHSEALRLLADSRLALVQVAASLGYSEQTSFTRAFKRWTGSTPAAWRAAQQAARLGR